MAARLDARVGSKRVVTFALVALLVATLGIVSTGPGFTLFALALSEADTGGLFTGSADAEKRGLSFTQAIPLPDPVDVQADAEARER